MSHDLLIKRARRHRRLAGTLIARQPLLKRTDVGMRMLQALGVTSHRVAQRVAHTWQHDPFMTEAADLDIARTAGVDDVDVRAIAGMVNAPERETVWAGTDRAGPAESGAPALRPTVAAAGPEPERSIPRQAGTAAPAGNMPQSPAPRVAEPAADRAPSPAAPRGARERSAQLDRRSTPARSGSEDATTREPTDRKSRTAEPPLQVPVEAVSISSANFRTEQPLAAPGTDHTTESWPVPPVAAGRSSSLAQAAADRPQPAASDTPPTPSAVEIGQPAGPIRSMAMREPGAQVAPAAQQPDPSPHVTATDERPEAERMAAREPEAQTPAATEQAIPPRGDQRPAVPERHADDETGSGAQVAEPTNGDSLFQPRSAERSPKEWARLLAQATSVRATESAGRSPQPASQKQTDASRQQPLEAQALPQASTAPMSESARRFLRPLVGVDPASVRVHQSEAADRVVSAQGADAAAIGDDVLLAAGHADESPETLGLLAHELTHVARRRAPRFVPPAVRHSRSAADEEEALALSVEAQVRQAARQPETQPRDQWPRAEPATVAAETPEVSVMPEPQSVPDTVESRPDRSRWGDLPAPWEPLPDWMGTPGPEPPTSTLAQGPITSAPVPASTAQFAEHDRSIPQEVPPPAAPAATQPQAAHAPGAAGAPEPDLDALARQVYSVLKQRLSAERRRLG